MSAAGTTGSDGGVRTIPIAPAWAGHPVGFVLLTQGKRQFVAFYDGERRMTVASRLVSETTWRFKRLPERLGWDSHNYITMVLDDEGYLHLSGNMHCHPLVYFRSNKPHDIESMQRIPALVGKREKRCTYPRFLRGARQELIFTYRDGGSGNGDQLYNVYDLKTKTWRRLMDQPLLSGEGKMNAYLHGPVQDATGVFHLCWVWRDTPDCATNHDLSYARSRDLMTWETSAGKKLSLPMTRDTGEIIDPVPPGGGIINGNTKIGFDVRNWPVIAYHKYDAQGRTQLYNARLEGGAWKIYQTSEWTYRWEFSGGGSIAFAIGFGPVAVDAAGRLTQSYRNPKHGSGTWILDAATLKPVGMVPRRTSMPASLKRLTTTATRPGMQVRWCSDAGGGGDAGVTYRLRWETLGRNRDRPHEGAPPAPSTLQLVEIRS